MDAELEVVNTAVVEVLPPLDDSSATYAWPPVHILPKRTIQKQMSLVGSRVRGPSLQACFRDGSRPCSHIAEAATSLYLERIV